MELAWKHNDKGVGQVGGGGERVERRKRVRIKYSQNGTRWKKIGNEVDFSRKKVERKDSMEH